jgi:uncharacterized membrane protein
MSVQAKRVLWRFLIFGLFGLLIEVFFGASGDLIQHGRWNLRGGTSPWMMFDYGLLGIILMPVAQPMKRRGVPLPVRAILYMVMIFAVEFVSGWVFDLLGIKIWDYSDKRFNLYGYITLMYTPFWYALGLGAEYVYKKVDAMALVLALGLTAERIEADAAPRFYV